MSAFMDEPNLNYDEPTPVRYARWFAALTSGGLSLAVLMAALNLGDFQYYDRKVTGPELLQLFGIPMGAFLLFSILLCLGLWLRLSWVRPFFLGSLAFGSVIGLVYHPGPRPPPGLSEVITGLVLVALCAWYLYGNSAARRYFDSFSAPRDSGAGR